MIEVAISEEEAFCFQHLDSPARQKLQQFPAVEKVGSSESPHWRSFPGDVLG